MAVQFRGRAGRAAYDGYGGGEWVRDLFHLWEFLLQHVFLCVVLDSGDEGDEFGEDG